jgi:hypothetical protein
MYCSPQCRGPLSSAQGLCNVSFLPKRHDSLKYTLRDALRGFRVDTTSPNEWLKWKNKADLALEKVSITFLDGLCKERLPRCSVAPTPFWLV